MNHAERRQGTRPADDDPPDPVNDADDGSIPDSQRESRTEGQLEYDDGRQLQHL